MAVNLEETYQNTLKGTTNCVNKCSNLSRLKTVYAYNCKYSMVRWAGAKRWMALRLCWNGCSVGILVTSQGSSCQAFL